ncbi:membrane protein [Mycobacterium avium subsp. paratuberculosis 08-8281]|nr:membrane protein [Mycobacterium avium subsp. paratuberculosis 08-8281]
MSGSRPPGWEPEEPDPAADPIDHQPDPGGPPADEFPGEDFPAGGDHEDAVEPFDDSVEFDAADQTGQTDAYSRAYSAPESEHFTSGPYVPADLRLYDYDDYDEPAELDEEHGTARWPWVVGVAAIVAAIALVVSVSLLFARTDTTKLANPNTTTASTPPLQDEITTTKPPPPPPPSASDRHDRTAARLQRDQHM